MTERTAEHADATDHGALARRLLETWGIGAMASASGGRDRLPSVDEETVLAAGRFVEESFGFWGARPVLFWRYALRHPDFDHYPFLRRDESYASALNRHGLQLELIEIGLPVALAAAHVHEAFLRELILRIQAEEEPF